MKHRDTEYRILKNGTGNKFMVEIKDGSFMGRNLWRSLRRDNDLRYTLHDQSLCYRGHEHLCDILTGETRKTYYLYTTELNNVVLFLSCKGAKKAAIDYINAPYVNQWVECRC